MLEDKDREAAMDGYEITLKGKGLNLSRQISEPLAKRIMSIVMGGTETDEFGSGTRQSSAGNYLDSHLKPLMDDIADRLAQLNIGGWKPRTSSRSQRYDSKRGSHRNDMHGERGAHRRENPAIRTYLDEVQAERNPEIIVAVAALLKKQLDWDVFSATDIKSQLRNAGVRVPGNLSRDLKWTEDIGWIERDEDSPGYYRLTELGLLALEEKFSSDVREGTTKKTTESDPSVKTFDDNPNEETEDL